MIDRTPIAAGLRVPDTGVAGFNMVRFYAIFSLVLILLCAISLVLFYRVVAIDAITELGKKSNLTIARTALNSLQHHLVDYVNQVADVSADRIQDYPITEEIDMAIQRLMVESKVVRIKIYNRRGIVVFSTKPNQIGNNQSENPGFLSAINGHVESKLIYHDTFNAFDRVTEEDNLIQSYIPVRRTPTAPINGVFEIYTDVNQLVARTELTQFKIIVGATLILLILYGMQLLLVRHSELIITRQQNTIEQRTAELERLSAQLIQNQEAEKRQIAWELHEGVIQTLGALKFHLGMAIESVKNHEVEQSVKALEAVVPTLVESMQGVRATAMDLRPSSLDDFGIVKALEGLNDKYDSLYTAIDIEMELSVEEQLVPDELKTTLYRIVQTVLDNLTQQPGINNVSTHLHHDEGELHLEIDFGGEDFEIRTEDNEADLIAKSHLSHLKERVYLSGGSLQMICNRAGQAAIRINWVC